MNQELGALDSTFRSPSALTLQNLRYALAAAEHGSFRQAAEVLLLQQSTLSRCVRQLEDLIGMAVFERSSGGVRATQAGLQFLRSGEVDPRASAGAGRDGAEHGPRRSRPACGRVLHIVGRGESSRDADGRGKRFPQLELEMFECSRANLVDSASQRRGRYCDHPGRHAAARNENHAAVERADSRGGA